MSQILTLALRPQSLGQLIGQKSVVSAIRNQVAKRMPQAWMFTGGPGSGKTTTARIIALAVQCDHQKPELWGNACEDCRKLAYNIHETNASLNSGVEDMEKLAALSRYFPSTGKYRIIILDEAQLVTTQGQNLLLKDFEDTPPKTIWIICTTDPRKVLSAMQRRCKTATYQLASLSEEGRSLLIERAIKHTGFKAEPSHMATLRHAVNTNELSASDTLSAFERFAAGMSAQAAVIGAESKLDSLRVCRAVLSKSWNELKTSMADAKPEDARWIQSSVLGYLKGCLMREADAKKRIALAEAMLDLTAPAPLEDALRIHWTLATLYKVMRRLV